MTLAGSIILIAIGATLRFADFTVGGLDLPTIGLALIIVGCIGLLLGIWQWTLWSRGSRREEANSDAPHPRRP
ncbi:MAG: hypothetical protein JST59_14120 [Actinobacteria bacterium]|nr:hypothetical protein [Actinomycetota bacterium]